MSQLRDQVLKAIIGNKTACITPMGICEKIQCPPDVVQDCLLDLETDNIISSWEPDDSGIVVTLTPIGAAKLGVHIVEYTAEEQRWAYIGEPEPHPKSLSPLFRGRPDTINLVIDDTPGPDIQAMLSEDIGVVSTMSKEKRKTLSSVDWRGVQRFDQFSLPYPTTLLGAGTALWDNVKYDVCPGCKGKGLETYEYCLRCDNWGMDRFLQKGNPERILVRAYVQRKAERLDIKKRKEKRNARFHAQGDKKRPVTSRPHKNAATAVATEA